MVQVLPAAKLDVLVNVDTWQVVSYKTDRARAAFELGEQETTFVRREGVLLLLGCFFS